ncbi:PEP-utilizing enzyme [Photobacterium swingsii]|uniref:PEP-utilizing enzyme n=1 Tax=Photobacterium swingsii TaxID=680026 RepID=UPI00352EC00E
MQLFLLGAGRPAKGDKPTALKQIALNTKALDWQIHSFESVVEAKNIHFLGGYHVDEVTRNYPLLNISFIPDWERNGVLHTFLRAPFTKQPVFTAYTDTVFRKKIVEKMSTIDEDVVFGVDFNWKERYESRSHDDINSAEKVLIGSVECEFTGLVKFSSNAIDFITTLERETIGDNLLDLINCLKENGFSVVPYDVKDEWAEFNSSGDIARFILGTKAETLARLEPIVQKSHIGRQVSFTSSDWDSDNKKILTAIKSEFDGEKLVVRSSSKGEDNWYSSNAGGFESLLNVNVNNLEEVRQSVETVIASYGEQQNGDDQILVQPFLTNVKASGVVFTCSLESGAPYYRFNFDDKTQSTESVTAGTHSDLRTVIVSRLNTGYLDKVSPELVPVLEAIQELELLLGYDKLDIEFAIDNHGTVHIFQVRPVTVDHAEFDVDNDDVQVSLNNAMTRFKTQQIAPPLIYGERAIFANMPDWNPAEIIGTRPKPLAFSLYRQLITNDVWAQQRAEFGYRDVRPYPLIISFSGQPYVDARASLNSFIPAGLPEDCAERIASAYINILADNPYYHDKIEFDVAFTIWTHDFREQAELRLLPYGVSVEDIDLLESALKGITCNALTRLTSDILSIETLRKRSSMIENSRLSTIDKVFALLDDCKRYGTLAFSHAARAGFVATTLLKAFVATGVLSDSRRLEFLKSFDTVAGGFEADKSAYANGSMNLDQLIDKYGHLRPGTYEVGALAYWENPDKYIVVEKNAKHEHETKFVFNASEINGFDSMLKAMGSSISASALIEYIKAATQAREFVKFEFTRNLSRSLDYCVLLGSELGLTRDELSFLEFNDLEQLKLNTLTTDSIKLRVEQRQLKHAITCAVELPPLIKDEADFYCFERFSSQPNFVTINKVDGLVKRLTGGESNDLSGMIVMIPQADPGYDWLFGHGIAGLITQYGGANSHMAIRAAEIGLPAAIGVGEKLYEKISMMKRLELDCANQVIREV